MICNKTEGEKDIGFGQVNILKVKWAYYEELWQAICFFFVFLCLVTTTTTKFNEEVCLICGIKQGKMHTPSFSNSQLSLRQLFY